MSFQQWKILILAVVCSAMFLRFRGWWKSEGNNFEMTPGKTGKTSFILGGRFSLNFCSMVLEVLPIHSSFQMMNK